MIYAKFCKHKYLLQKNLYLCSIYVNLGYYIVRRNSIKNKHK